MDAPRQDRVSSERSRSRLVVVANRLPVHRVRTRDGAVWKTSPGGLVSALMPVLRKSNGTWVGWTGEHGEGAEPFEQDGIRNVPIALSKVELEHFYEGFSNRTLWPLYHDAIRRPEFHREWWGPYVAINERFARATAAEADRGATVWVQDYHLQLVPRMLRELRPDLRIGFFLHIPFPPRELFAQLPWRREILEGLLGSDLIGCQVPQGAKNFAQLAVRYAGAEVDPQGLRFEGRCVRFGAFPISIDVGEIERIADLESTRQKVRRIRAKLGDSRKILLGVDRLDYTKGIDLRLKAMKHLLEQGEVTSDECVLVQSAVPSRENVNEYALQKRLVEQLVGEINGRFGELGRAPVHYLHRNLGIEDLVALYMAADVMLVTPLRDGMNLVCKEYIASRLDHTGVLVLSEFAGAAKELDVGALLVNPHNLDELASSFVQSIRMSAEEAATRMRLLREKVKENDVYRWAGSFLHALEEIGTHADVPAPLPAEETLSYAER